MKLELEKLFGMDFQEIQQKLKQCKEIFYSKDNYGKYDPFFAKKKNREKTTEKSKVRIPNIKDMKKPFKNDMDKDTDVHKRIDMLDSAVNSVRFSSGKKRENIITFADMIDLILEM